MLAWEPLLPAGAVLLGGAAAAAVSVAVYRRPCLPLGLRLGAVALLTAMLLNPVLRHPVPQASPSTVVIAVDTSGSMARRDGTGGRTRGDEARAAATDLAQALGPAWRVQVTGFNDHLTSPVPPTDGGDSGFGCLADLAAMTPAPTAAVVLSDGADWAGADPETPLAAAGIAVHTLGVGSAAVGENATVVLQVPSPSLAPGQEVPLGAEISATTGLHGRTVRLVVERADGPGAGSVLAEVPVTLGSWQRIAVTDQAGTAVGGRLWRARLEALPGETTAADNTAYAAAQVVDRTLRILVLEGRPCWDTTFLVRGWRRDRQIQVDTAYGVGKGTWKAGIEALPPDATALRNFDVLVLGQGISALAPSSEVLTAWVDGGGRLILLGPVAHPGFEALDPLPPKGAAVATTIPAGGLLPGDQALQALVAPATPRPQTLILAGTREQPAIGVRRTGGGNVLRLNLDGLWRWHLGKSGRDAGERFCRELLRAVARSPQGELWAERLRLPAGATAVLWTRPDARVSRLLHTRPDGTTANVAVDGAGLRLPLDQPGVHRFAAGPHQVSLVVEARLGESTNPARDDARLRRLAERTGGTVGDAARWRDLAGRLQARTVLGAPTTRSEPLVGQRWWLLALVLLAGAEWWIRRRTHGLV